MIRRDFTRTRSWVRCWNEVPLPAGINKSAQTCTSACTADSDVEHVDGSPVRVHTLCHVSRADVDQSDEPVLTPCLTNCQLVLLYLLALMDKCKNKRLCFCCYEQLVRLPPALSIFLIFYS